MGGLGETRKIQLTGKSTYIVSLPKWWVTEMKLKAGDVLTFQRLEDSTLLITPNPPEPGRVGEVEVRIWPEENPYAIVRKIISLYLIGYNVIRLLADRGRISSTQREIIKQLVRKKLMGTEITSDSPHEMIIQTLLGYTELSVKGALRRMSTVTTSMWGDTMAALRKLDQGLANEVIEMDDEVDRFSMYIIRQLKSAVGDPRLIEEIGLNTARDCLGYRLITKSVERVADHAVLASEKILQLKKPLKGDVFKKMTIMSTSVGSMFGRAIQSLFKFNYDLAEEIVKKVEGIEPLEGKVIRLIREEFREDAINLRLIAESLRRVAEYSTDIAEVVLNLTCQHRSGR